MPAIFPLAQGPLASDQLASIMDIWLAANLQAHSFIPASYWHNAAPLVRELLPQAEVYILARENSADISGFIGLTPQTDGAVQAAYIAGLFIRPAEQSQGFGRLLLEQAKQQYPRLSLHVYRQNSGACRFYQREGFRLVCSQTDTATGEEELKMLWP